MASSRDIRTKISSIKKTQKITKAMQMVAASNMRKAQDRMQASRPYAEKMFEVISHLAKARPQYRHSYLTVREVKRVGYIVVSTERGLCGALNANLLKETFFALKGWQEKEVAQDICLIGTKAEGYFHRFGGNVVAKAVLGGDEAAVQKIIGAVQVMLKAFNEEKIDELYICYNEFVNTMVQQPKLRKLLPIGSITEETQGNSEWVDKEIKKRYWDYIYEPDSRQLLDRLLGRYIEALVYQGCVENGACEQAARMVSMKNATENAGKLIDELQLMYNKARQAAITNEISEIVSGAQAIDSAS